MGRAEWAAVALAAIGTMAGAWAWRAYRREVTDLLRAILAELRGRD